MKEEILIPSAIIPNAYFLGPMGDPDSSDFIYQENKSNPLQAVHSGFVFLEQDFLQKLA